jgi:hypothetical protein
MKTLLQSPFFLLLVSLMFLHTSPLFGQAATAAPKVKKIPFHGKIVALDQSGGTITLNGKTARVLHITPATAIVDGSDNPTTLSAATVGEDVGGSYTKDASGTLTAAKLRIGAKIGSKTASTTPAAVASAPTAAAAASTAPATTPAQTAASDAATATKPATTTAATATPAKAKKTHFSGTVTAVDATSITIKTRTFTVTSATTITDSTGAASTLSAVTVGTKVSGSYEKAADGSMTALTIKIGK